MCSSDLLMADVSLFATSITCNIRVNFLLLCFAANAVSSELLIPILQSCSSMRAINLGASLSEVVSIDDM